MAQLLRLDHDVAALGDLVALSDVLVGTSSPVSAETFFSRMRLIVRSPELAERHRLLADAAVQLDGDGDESETAGFAVLLQIGPRHRRTVCREFP